MDTKLCNRESKLCEIWYILPIRVYARFVFGEFVFGEV
ncbi:hypothetical protein E2C01_058458 [Portunus trituberculatus]|uniref:Uncharacterized protein n=1 Tax=Portunus trituberculatus TaxID=210409 RepID=A0A5B7H661_PORTR|nr:hypothetical protein [Portunus trituberculatus]